MFFMVERPSLNITLDAHNIEKAECHIEENKNRRFENDQYHSEGPRK